MKSDKVEWLLDERSARNCVDLHELKPPVGNWCNWLKRFKETNSHEERLGLLHMGFQVPYWGSDNSETGIVFTDQDRLETYLHIADGWDRVVSSPDQDEIFEVGYDERQGMLRKSSDELRKELSRKAFDVLCQCFFKFNPTDSDAAERYWSSLIRDARKMSAIKRFLALERGRRFKTIKNLTYRDWHDEERNRSESQVIIFLVTLAHHTWKWRKPCVDRSAVKETRRYNQKIYDDEEDLVNSHKPWLLEILCCLKKIFTLRPYMLSMDKECLVKLQEIAMSTNIRRRGSVDDDRKVMSLEEAVYANSQAALFLIEQSMCVKVQGNLTAVHEAEVELREARRRAQQ